MRNLAIIAFAALLLQDPALSAQGTTPKDSPGAKALEAAKKARDRAVEKLGMKNGSFRFKGKFSRKEILEKLRAVMGRYKKIQEKWIEDLEKLNRTYAADPAINRIRWELGRAYLRQGKGKKAREILALLGPTGFDLDERMEIIRLLLNFDMEKKAGAMLTGLDISKIREARPRLLAAALAAATGKKDAAMEGLKEELAEIEDGEEMWDVVDDLERRLLIFPAALYRPTLALLYEKALERFPASDPEGKRKALLKGLSIRMGTTPPPLEVTDLKGRKLTWASLSGKAVLLYFWATWKPSSLKRMESLKKIYGKFHGKGFEILGVSLDKPPSDAAEYAAKAKLPWIQVCDGKAWEGPLVNIFAVKELPFAVLIGPKGKVAGLDIYGKDLEARLMDLLGKS